MSQVVKVDIWSDIACPFCYLGKRKFEAGVTASGVAVEVEYRSFELAPDTPVEVSGSHLERLAEKLRVSLDEARAMEQRVTDLAREIGLAFDYGRVRPTRTLNAHQLLHYAKARGSQVAMKERLLAAYFTEGRQVGRIDELADLAAEVGLDREDVVRSLGAGEYLDAVAADIRQAAAYGIRSVPFFVVDGRYGVSGAQEPAAFAQVLTQARAEQPAGS